jgi:uncharacterized membrane protein
MSQWHLEPIFGSPLLVALAALALVGLLLVRPGFVRLAPWQKTVLVLLRVAVVLLAVVAMLRPTWSSTVTRRQSATLIVLVDLSRSMTVPDMPGSRTRWEALRETLASARSQLAALAEDLEIKVYGFHGEARPIPFESGRIPLPEKPDGGQTDHGTALDDVFRGELGKRLAGVILLGDGSQRAYAPRVEAQQAARELARLGYPLYTVPFGLPRDETQARDVAVENLPDQYTVFVKNELVVRALVRISGYARQDVPVELAIRHPDGREEIVGPRLLRAVDDGQRVDFETTYVPPLPGQYRLTVRAHEQPGELVARNNQLSAFLTVLEGGLKVLYLEGNVAWQEQKFLRQSLDSSPDIQLDFRWIDPRLRKQMGRWPVNLDAELSDPKYDVFMLREVDSAALGERNLAALAAAVDKGKGLLMMGGYHSFGPGGYLDAANPLADVLPVTTRGRERQDYDAPVRHDRHHPGPLAMMPAGDHFITHLGSDNRAAWQKLPPLEGANRFDGLKPRAQVLAKTSDGIPLLVASEYGGGRVLALAGDSTFRWWRYGHQAEHKRFWRQAILWLAQKDQSARHDVWIELAQRRFHPGAAVPFAAGARAAGGDVIDDAVLSAEVTLPDGRKLPLPLAASADQFAGEVADTAAAGDYLIVVTAARGGQPLGTARAEFTVFDQDLEMSDPSANPGLLAMLADLTKESGGRSLPPEQLASLLEEIRRSPPELQIEVATRWQLADTATDAWLFLMALVGFLSAEWVLRKRWGMV